MRECVRLIPPRSGGGEREPGFASLEPSGQDSTLHPLCSVLIPWDDASFSKCSTAVMVPWTPARQDQFSPLHPSPSSRLRTVLKNHTFIS